MSALLASLLGRTFRAKDPDDDGSLDDGLDRGDNLGATDDTDTDDDAPDDGGKADGDDEADGDDDVLDYDTDDDEDADANDDDEGDTKAARPKTIPISRFNEAQRKSRERMEELQKQIETLQKKTTAEETKSAETDLEAAIDDLEKQHNDALKDGDAEAAGRIRREIRHKEREAVLLLSKQTSTEARNMAVEEVRVDLLIERLESDYPMLDPESNEYDEDMISLISATRRGYEAEGMASSAALEKASQDILTRLAPDTKKPLGKRGGLGSDEVTNRRGKQVKRNIEDSKRQPPNTASIGKDSNKKGGGVDTDNVLNLSDEELEALPKATLAKLRGDLLTS